jgi:hypothetical protein
VTADWLHWIDKQVNAGTGLCAEDTVGSFKLIFGQTGYIFDDGLQAH